MSSSILPPPADKPDDGYNPTWRPETFPSTISGIVEARVTLRYRRPRDPDRPTFEKLTVQTPDGELIDVMCTSIRLGRLVIKHDPRPGDPISITAFGPDSNNWPQFGMVVDRSARVVGGGDEPSEISKQAEELFGDEEAAR